MPAVVNTELGSGPAGDAGDQGAASPRTSPTRSSTRSSGRSSTSGCRARRVGIYKVMQLLPRGGREGDRPAAEGRQGARRGRPAGARRLRGPRRALRAGARRRGREGRGRRPAERRRARRSARSRSSRAASAKPSTVTRPTSSTCRVVERRRHHRVGEHAEDRPAGERLDARERRLRRRRRGPGSRAPRRPPRRARSPSQRPMIQRREWPARSSPIDAEIDSGRLEMKTAATNETLTPPPATQREADRRRLGDPVEQRPEDDRPGRRRPRRRRRAAVRAALARPPRSRRARPPASPIAAASPPPSSIASSVRSKATALISTPAPNAITKAIARLPTGSPATRAISAPSTSASPPTSPQKRSFEHARSVTSGAGWTVGTPGKGTGQPNEEEKVMTETIKQAKLIQYLSEAYGKEKELETALEAHIAMTTRKPYAKRLQEHLKETKAHARELERRIKKLGGGGPQLAEKVAGQAAGQGEVAGQGPAARGPRHRRGREDAQEREDRVLQRARGDRHLHARSRRSPRASATPRRRSSRARSAATRSGWRASSRSRSRC